MRVCYYLKIHPNENKRKILTAVQVRESMQCVLCSQKPSKQEEGKGATKNHNNQQSRDFRR